MNSSKILSLLGFAAKAGKLSYGTHATEFAITSNKAKMVCVAQDISAKTVKELKFKAQKQNIPVIILEGIDTIEVSSKIGKNCGVIAVNDIGFADAVQKNIKEE